MEKQSEPLDSSPRSACYETSSRHVFAVAVTADDGHDYLFATAQFLDAELEYHPKIEEDKRHPSERLRVNYATGQIIILGRGLRRLALMLQRGQLESLKPLAPRYAELPQSGPTITSIVVTRKEVA